MLVLKWSLVSQGKKVDLHMCLTSRGWISRSAPLLFIRTRLFPNPDPRWRFYRTQNLRLQLELGTDRFHRKERPTIATTKLLKTGHIQRRKFFYFVGLPNSVFQNRCFRMCVCGPSLHGHGPGIMPGSSTRNLTSHGDICCLDNVHNRHTL